MLIILFWMPLIHTFFCSPEDRPAGMSASELISSACFRPVVAMKNPFLVVEMTG